MSKILRVFLTAEALAIALSACVDTTPEPTVAAFTEVAPGPSPTPIACTPNSAGLLLEVQPFMRRGVHVSGQGFIPGERLLIVIEGEAELAAGGAQTVTLQLEETVDREGGFGLTEEPLASETAGPVVWSVSVVHARGVACATAKSR